MATTNRPGKVFLDWSQNDPGKSTVAPYSLRGRELPTVSMPVAWEEVDAVVANGDLRPLTFLASEALLRTEAGDPFAPVPVVSQRLPSLATPE